MESENHNISRDINGSRINTISHDIEGYENDFESDKETKVKISKTPVKNDSTKGIKNKNPTPRPLKEVESKATISSKTPNDNKRSPSCKKSDLTGIEDKHKNRNSNKINNISQLQNSG